jgi:hypothetical protein
MSVATGAEIPGGLLGISGGIEIDTNTGQIIGGSLGGEIGGFGINVSNSSKGGLGIEFTYQIPGTPIELSLGFGFPPDPDPKEPTPTPGSCSSPGSTTPFRTNWEKPNLPTGDSNRFCNLVLVFDKRQISWYPDGKLYFHWESSGTGKFDPVTRIASVTIETVTDFPDPKPQPNSVCFNGTIQTNNVGEDRFFPGVYKIHLLRNEGIYSDEMLYVWGREDKVYDFLARSTEAHYAITYEATPFAYRRILNKTYKVIYSSCSLPSESDPSNPSAPQPPITSPFPNSPPRKRNMDECCRESTKLLRAIHKRLGISKFPGKLPETIIQETPKEGEEPSEPAQVPIEDFVDLLKWQFERDDERWGQWQVELDIKDADITKEGDQKKQIKLPNLAESIGEFQGQLLSIMTNVDALVALQIKCLAESGMARQEAIKGYLAAKAIIKYMAFKSTEIDVPIPMSFTAGAETISKLLEESEGHIKGMEYTEKETWRDVYLDLLQAAAITRAVHWQRINTKTDTKSQLLSILKGSVDLATSIGKPQKPNGDGDEKTFNPEENFEDFLDNVEDGFRKTTGITDVQNPYGKSPNRRPRIRQIGDNISQAGADK